MPFGPQSARARTSAAADVARAAVSTSGAIPSSPSRTTTGGLNPTSSWRATSSVARSRASARAAAVRPWRLSARPTAPVRPSTAFRATAGWDAGVVRCADCRQNRRSKAARRGPSCAASAWRSASLARIAASRLGVCRSSSVIVQAPACRLRTQAREPPRPHPASRQPRRHSSKEGPLATIAGSTSAS